MTGAVRRRTGRARGLEGFVKDVLAKVVVVAECGMTAEDAEQDGWSILFAFEVDVERVLWIRKFDLYRRPS